MSFVSFKGFSFVTKISRIPLFQCFPARHTSVKNDIQETEVVTDAIENVISEKEVKIICNKSRLNKAHRNLLNGQVPYDEPVHRFHNTVKYKRRMYGRYGDSSKVYPGLAWPTAEDLEDIREYEKIAYPLTIQEMQQNALEKLEFEKKRNSNAPEKKLTII